MRFSTWNTPRFICCYGEDLEWLHLPRGLTERVDDLLVGLGSRLDLGDDRPDPSTIELRFVGDASAPASRRGRRSRRPRPRGARRPARSRQDRHGLRRDRPPPHVRPSSSSTARSSSTSGDHDSPSTSVSTPTRSVRSAAARDTPTGVVDVAMIQSLARRDDPSVFDPYGLVVVDECHHLPAVSFATCVRDGPGPGDGSASPPPRTGATSSKRSSASNAVPTRHEIKPGAVAGAELVRRELVVHHTATEVSEDERAHIQAGVHRARRRRPTNRHRSATTSIAPSRAVAPASSSPNAPTTSTRSSPGSPTSATTRSCSAAASARKHERPSATPSPLATPDAGIVLVATGSYLGEGFDWPELDTLFLAFPLAFKGRVVQYVGRLLRTHEGKHHVELHDYVDARIPVLDRMHTKRLPAYATLGFDVPRTRRPARPPITGPTDPPDTGPGSTTDISSMSPSSMKPDEPRYQEVEL